MKDFLGDLLYKAQDNFKAAEKHLTNCRLELAQKMYYAAGGYFNALAKKTNDHNYIVDECICYFNASDYPHSYKRLQEVNQSLLTEEAKELYKKVLNLSHSRRSSSYWPNINDKYQKAKNQNDYNVMLEIFKSEPFFTPGDFTPSHALEYVLRRLGMKDVADSIKQERDGDTAKSPPDRPWV